MALSAALCRAQEREQLERAAGATLKNVRVIAERAAKAWAVEAALMEKVERKKADLAQARLAGEAAAAEADSEEAHVTWLSENPDRGLSG